MALASDEAGAQSVSPQAQVLGKRTIRDLGKTFELVELIDETGTYEVEIFLIEERGRLPSTRRVLLIGRSIEAALPEGDAGDVSRRITTWFFPTPYKIIEPVEYFQIASDPWPAARSIIESYLDTDSRWLAWVGLVKVAQGISLAAASNDRFFEDLKRDQIKLYDLEIRIKRREIVNPHDPLLPIMQQIVVDGWEDLDRRIKRQLGPVMQANTAGDLAITVLGGKLVSVVGKGISIGALKLVPGSAKSLVSRTLGGLMKGVGRKVQVVKSAFSRRLVSASVQTPARMALARMAVHQRVGAAVSFLQTKTMLGRFAVKSSHALIGTVRAGFSQLAYIAVGQSAQVTAEVAARPDDLFDPNPLIMARKLASDEDFVQNLAYMTNESFWMAGVSTYVTSSLKKRMAICAVIGAVDSIFMSYLIKGEPDPERLALDVSWQSIVGNIQTQIDVGVLGVFEGLAEKSGYGGLKLVGYAITVVDQLAGSYGYAKATNYLERWQNGRQEEESLKVQVVPIYGPQ